MRISKNEATNGKESQEIYNRGGRLEKGSPVKRRLNKLGLVHEVDKLTYLGRQFAFSAFHRRTHSQCPQP